MGPIIFLVILNQFTNAAEKVIYGEDNRIEVYESVNPLWKNLSAGTAAMVSKKKLNEKNGAISIQGKSLKENLNLCDGERFENQKNPALCSGFLLGTNLLITAGHCASKNYCQNYVWVFGMYQSEESNDLLVPIQSVYNCKKIIYSVADRVNREDWGLIELDREVKGVIPLNFRSEGEISFGEPLVVIGHPSGLSTKIAAGGLVRKNENSKYFEANLDTFGGSSGSAVFNENTGLVEGILVRGEQDYEEIVDNGKRCFRVKYCQLDGCRGEDIQKIPPEIKRLF